MPLPFPAPLLLPCGATEFMLAPDSRYQVEAVEPAARYCTS